MPFVHWTVEPRYVSKKEIDKSLPDELEAVANQTLVCLVQQLACVIKLANFVFEAVGQDLKTVQHRSQKLRSRIKSVEAKVLFLDAKIVRVPLGDLTSFSQLKEHYAASQVVHEGLFDNSQRPLCVEQLYNAALASPLHIIRQIDQYREDGCRSSKYFVCTPVVSEAQKKLDLEIETRRPASLCTARNWQSDEELGIPDVFEDEQKAPNNGTQCYKNGLLKLPSPQERIHALSLKYPYSDVPIDVTGSGFRRMTSFRRSLVQQVEFFTRKRKKKKVKNNRRNTISGGTDVENTLVENQSKKSQPTTNNQAKKRFSIADGGSLFKSGAFEHMYCSLRLPVKNKGVQTSEADSSSNTELEYKKNKSNNVRNSKRNADKTIDQEGTAKEKSKNKIRSLIPISTLSQAMSVAVKLRGSTSRNSAKNEDSGQSSSGNWSASSSTRASVESENLNPTTTHASELVRVSSQTSLSKDSALSEGTTPNEDIRSNSNIGYHSDASVSTSASNPVVTIKPIISSAAADTVQWLQSLQKEMQNVGDVTDTASTTGTLTPLLGKRALSPFDLPLAFVDDEQSSVYSVDTDGYYTSMHTDSGLRSMSGGSKPTDTNEGNSRRETTENDNCSTLSSVSSIDSENKQEPQSEEKTKRTKQDPPLPPKRHSSLNCNLSIVKPILPGGAIKVCSTLVGAMQNIPSSSSSESDVDLQENFNKKTIINASRIPSLCIVTPTASDEEDQNKPKPLLKETPKPARATKSAQTQMQIVNLNSKDGSADMDADIYEFSYDSAEYNKSGFHTIPRSFGRSQLSDTHKTYAIHSWPRSISSTGNRKPIERFNSLSTDNGTCKIGPADTRGSNQENNLAMIPLKYVHHLTITPGRQNSLASDSGEKATASVVLNSKRKSSEVVSVSTVFAPTNTGEQTTVIYPTNSLERKTFHLSTTQGGAHVILNAAGSVIHTGNGSDVSSSSGAQTRTIVPITVSAESTNNSSLSNSLSTESSAPNKFLSHFNPSLHRILRTGSGIPVQKPMQSCTPASQQDYFRRKVQYDSNTLPRIRVPQSKPAPLFPLMNKKYEEIGSDTATNKELFLSRNVSRAATLPRTTPWTRNLPSNGRTPNSSLSDSDSQSSPKANLTEMPPPMTLIIPPSHQAAHRWSYAGHSPCPSLQPIVYPATPTSASTPSETNCRQPVYCRPMTNVPNYQRVNHTPAFPQNVRHPTPTYQQPQTPTPHYSSLSQYAYRTSSPQANLNHRRPACSSRIPSPSFCSPVPVDGRQLLEETSTNDIWNTRGTAPPSTFSPVNHPPAVRPPPPPLRQHNFRTSTPRMIPPSSTSQVPPNWPCQASFSYTDADDYRQVRNGSPTDSFQRIESRNGYSENRSRNDNAVPFMQMTTLGNHSDDRHSVKEQYQNPVVAAPLKSGKGTMSADDLFAAIHRSKKRLNVRSDADHSRSPVSSRSASPALSVNSYSSKGSIPETGMPSPRGLFPGDRRSWSGETGSTSPTNKNGIQSPGDRHSWAVDRLGPSKPTSMHDFKMLLLQAGRGGTRDERQRLSASEMLKLSSPKKNIASNLVSCNGYCRSPMNASYGNSLSSASESPQNSPTSHRGHSQRSLVWVNYHTPVRGRCRTPFHMRTNILSTPIWEDLESSGNEDESENISTSSRTTTVLPTTSSPISI